MIDEPVQKLSGSSIKLNWAEVHRTNSSENLDRCVIKSVPAAAISITKSRSLTASNEFLLGQSNPNSFDV